MKEALNDTERETKLREDRSRNVIIYGVNEPTDNTRKEREEKDKVFVNHLCTEIEADEVEYEDVRRLGRKTEEKKRPLLIRWKSLEHKETFMSLLKNLDKSEDRYKKIDIRNDLTPEQNRQYKEAKKEAKELTTKEIESGFFIPGDHSTCTKLGYQDNTGKGRTNCQNHGKNSRRAGEAKHHSGTSLVKMESTNSEVSAFVPCTTRSECTSSNALAPVQKKMLEKLRCLYTNADQLPNKMSELRIRCATEDTEAPDVVCITEVKRKSTRCPLEEVEVKMDGYQHFHNNFAAKEHRGISIYVKEELEAVLTDIETDFCESLWIEITLGNTNKLLCGCIYRSPDHNQENVERLCDLICSAATKSNSHILITGDFNFPGIDWRCMSSSSKMENDFVEAIRDSYLYQHVVEPTRCRHGQNPSTLDLIFTNQEEIMTNIKYHSPLGKSDHSCIKFDFLCQLARHALHTKNCIPLWEGRLCGNEHRVVRS